MSGGSVTVEGTNVLAQAACRSLCHVGARRVRPCSSRAGTGAKRAASARQAPRYQWHALIKLAGSSWFGSRPPQFAACASSRVAGAFRITTQSGRTFSQPEQRFVASGLVKNHVRILPSTPSMHRPGRVEADVRVNRDYAAVAASIYAVLSGLFAGNGFEPPVPLRMSSAAACLPAQSCSHVEGHHRLGQPSRGKGADRPVEEGTHCESVESAFFHRTRSRA